MSAEPFLVAALQRAQQSLEELREAQNVLAKMTEGDKQRGLLVDATVKRFEVCFEYFWKLLKAASEYQGVEAPGPRPAIREGVRFQWIVDPEFWAHALDARNGSVRDYFGIPEVQYLQLIAQFISSASAVHEKILLLCESS